MSNEMAEDNPQYDCLECPSYCCGIVYSSVPIKYGDIQKIAKSLGIEFMEALKRYTRHDEEAEYPLARELKRKKDPLLGSCCIFLDTQTRRCTIHLERPEVCRKYPTKEVEVTPNRCVFYDLHTAVKKSQGKEFLPFVQIKSLER